MATQTKKETRFRYNQGVYQVRIKIEETWQPLGPEMGGNYAKCNEQIRRLEQSDPDNYYSLFFLKEQDNGHIDWVQASSNSYYCCHHRDEVLKLMKKLGIEMDIHGYSTLANITSISRSSIMNMLRQPQDPRYQALSSEGLIYMKYRVQEALKFQQTG